VRVPIASQNATHRQQRAPQWALAPLALAEWSLRLPDSFLSLRELPTLAAILLAGSLAGMIPAEKAFRNSLADGLTPRN